MELSTKSVHEKKATMTWLEFIFNPVQDEKNEESVLEVLSKRIFYKREFRIPSNHDSFSLAWLEL